MSRRFIQRMRQGANAYDHVNGGGDMIASVSPIVTTPGNKVFTMGPSSYTPPFKAQIQLTTEIAYYTEAAGVFTASNAAAILAAAINIQFPFFYFANGDFAAGWAQLQALYPLGGGWAYQRPLVFGKDYMSVISNGVAVPLTATVTNTLQKGDIIQAFCVTTGGVNYVALVITRCGDVPLATLLDTTNSNTFMINMIRYTVADSTAANLAQYRNKIKVTNESMFGKVSFDNTNPNSFKNPEQNQTNVIDIDINVGINKEKGLSSLFNYDAGALEWNLFIDNVVKIS